MHLNELRDKAYKCACDHGFHDEKKSNEHFLMLVITELSEAVEADRKARRANRESYELLFANSIERTGNKEYFNEVAFKHHIKDTVEDELADAVIRLLDLAGLRGISLELAREDIDNCVDDMVEACIDETFTESIYSISTLPERYKGLYDFDITINDMVLSLFGLAKHLDIDLMWHIETKIKYNELRARKHGNTCPDRHECALYTPEAEENKTEPDEDPGKKCEFFKRKGDKE